VFFGVESFSEAYIIRNIGHGDFVMRTTLVQFNEAFDVAVSLGKMNADQLSAIADYLVRYKPDVAQEMEFAISVSYKELQHA
jgi:hypothetical protein